MTTAELFYTLIGSLIGGALVFMVGLGWYIRHKMKSPPQDQDTSPD